MKKQNTHHLGVDNPTDVGKARIEWGSDAIAETIGRLDIPYVALNPDDSFRGLHDSFVNYLGNRDPEMLLCLHEDHVVSIAHGLPTS